MITMDIIKMTLKMAWNSCYKTDTIRSDRGKNDLDIHVIETVILPLLGNYSIYHVIKVLSSHWSVAAHY